MSGEASDLALGELTHRKAQKDALLQLAWLPLHQAAPSVTVVVMLGSR